MSAGQRPRLPEFFPHMKYRARKRNYGKRRVIVYGADFKPVWPQAFKIGGKSYPVDKVTLVTTCEFGRRELAGNLGDGTSFWISKVTATPVEGAQS